MSPVTLYLMRHGEPVLTGRLLGRTDCAVTAAGIHACRTQAEDLRVARIISSDLQRARACAEAIGPTVIDPRWRELDFGDWDGHAPADVDAAALSRFWSDPDAAPPPNGERWSALKDRVAEAIAALPPEPALVVTHGGAMRAALAILCGLDLAATWAIDLPYAAVLALKIWPGPPRAAQIAGLWP
ncbi:histidine phosphatase family protein [Sphingomonas sp. PB4P5]|uniref:histidine phosphatase family protein n=1 Tax=Parasphingomonas puruogangriensis TaxID=3096155 RepID=UPI002FC91429